MRAPESWPYASEAEWRLWRELLDEPLPEPVPHIATLKREADAEIARIARCTEAKWEPKRPALVPERIVAGSGVRR